MRRIVFILFSIVFSFIAKAQVVFKTIVPQKPVVAGESFQVQYVLEDVDKNNEFYPPDFKNFRFVSGPFMYDGLAYGTDGLKRLKNIVYTLEAIKPGKFLIPGASAKVDDRFIKSDNVLLEVISKTDALKKGLLFENPQTNTAYYLRPGEDPYEKIHNNLFLKVMVDKKTCFVGEPVTATFKLYSRLESRSDIVKNPGFYGFSVQDMIGLNDRLVTNETVNGKIFDVHTVRKVQLYPLQVGLFTIDPMEVENKVEFSTSSVSRKTEQEITEGVLPDNDNTYSNADAEVYESSMHTDPVSIIVKPSPQKNKPVDFTGATGNFSVSASADKNKLEKNEESELVITISGKGNFTQLTAPAVQWPEGIEGFESGVKDSLDNTSTPLKGNRAFHFPFVSSKAGNYILPAVSFSFFDPDSNNYKTVSTRTINIVVNENEKFPKNKPVINNASVTKNIDVIIWLGIFGLFIAFGGWTLWVRKRNKQTKDEFLPEKENIPPTVGEILQPASGSLDTGNKIFYTNLRSCIWNFFSIRFGLTGSKMNREYLLTVLQQKGVDENNQRAITEILQQCETGIYTDAHSEIDKKTLLEKAHEMLEQIDRYLV